MKGNRFWRGYVCCGTELRAALQCQLHLRGREAAKAGKRDGHHKGV